MACTTECSYSEDRHWLWTLWSSYCHWFVVAYSFQQRGKVCRLQRSEYSLWPACDATCSVAQFWHPFRASLRCVNYNIENLTWPPSSEPKLQYHVHSTLTCAIWIQSTPSPQFIQDIILSSTYNRRDRSVGIATSYGLDVRGVGVRVPVGSRIYLSPHRPDRRALGFTQPPIKWIPGALSPGIKRPGREADHSQTASADVKKTWIYMSTPPTPSWRSA
jgi:hypothetical protein